MKHIYLLIIMALMGCNGKDARSENEELNPIHSQDDVKEKKEGGNYKDGKKEGVWRHYEDGILRREETYKNGLYDGPVLNYYYATGELEEKNTYRDGKLEGEYIYYSKEGKNKILGQHKNGKMDGFWKYYSPVGGWLQCIVEYKNGKKHGTFVSYHPNHQMESEGKYKDHKMKGLWKYYDKNGVLIRDTYIND